MTRNNTIALSPRDAIRSALLRWSSANLRDYPWRQPDRSPYAVLLAEVLLKRTTATAAARVYPHFLQHYPSLSAIATAHDDELAAAFSSLGLQRQRAASLRRLADYLLEYEDGAVPADLDRLLRVPGLGAYSARAILSIGFGLPAAVVDGNVQRVYRRVFGLPERTSAAHYQSVADALLPADQHRQFNLAIIDLGALVCRPAKPACADCPLLSVCDYGQPNAAGPRSRTPKSALQEVRQEQGVTLVDLARRARVSKLTVINIEAGRTAAQQATVAKIAAALGVPPERITGSK